MSMQKTVIVKCGGNAAVDVVTVCRNIAELRGEGAAVVVVHGGSADIDRLAARLGVATRRMYATDGMSARYTDPATLEVVQLALAGAVKPRLVTALLKAGVSAIGLTGVDGGLVRAHRRTAQRATVNGKRVVVRDDHSGRVTGVDARLLTMLLAADHTPVISPPVLAADGRPVNADADRVAAAVAVALGASALVLLTGVPGVLADPADEAAVLDVCEVPASGPPPYVGGGIGTKLVAAREALVGGVPQVMIAQGARPRPVHRALAGEGTRVILRAPEPTTGPDARTPTSAR
ncbi:[LysW]-aminoadipate kinase [Streptosporangium sp. CA-115845]|uniref:[LysW]-aminoadipate kinase n=1 Tax=Streptosporangium sp. CA-115845 TaxID=3240071 RepID=UPI003D8A44D8